jgi:branched-chain amino acid transport system ATP-binding protein
LEANNKPTLLIGDLYVSYGHIRALKGVSMEIETGEIVSIIGANGAGKSTLLKTISGLLKPARGEIHFSNASIVGFAPEKITRMGLVQVPEGRQILATLTVYENLELGSIPLKNREEVHQKFEHVFQYFPVLKERVNQFGGTLSGGEQQMLAIGRALMGEPKLLMLDEPSLGLAPILVNEIFRIIRVLREDKRTILLVEQNARKALLTSDRSYLLENGLIPMSGASSEMINNQKIKASYLGTR